MAKISRLYNYANGTVADAAKVQAEMDNIIGGVNTLVDETAADRVTLNSTATKVGVLEAKIMEGYDFIDGGDFGDTVIEATYDGGDFTDTIPPSREINGGDFLKIT